MMLNLFFDVNGTCTYCGEPSDQIDHVIPISWLARNTSDKARQNLRHKGVRTYACGDCNRFLSDKVFPTFKLRVETNQLRLSKQWCKVSAPEWEQDELQALDHTLRDFVIRRQAKRYAVIRRYSWASTLSSHEIIYDLRADTVFDTQAMRYVHWLSLYFLDYLDESQRKRILQVHAQEAAQS